MDSESVKRRSYNIGPNGNLSLFDNHDLNASGGTRRFDQAFDS